MYVVRLNKKYSGQIHFSVRPIRPSYFEFAIMRLRSVFLVRRTVLELWGSKLPNFHVFTYFPVGLQNAENIPSGDQLTAQGYIAEWLRLFHVVMEGPKR